MKEDIVPTYLYYPMTDNWEVVQKEGKNSAHSVERGEPFFRYKISFPFRNSELA